MSTLPLRETECKINLLHVTLSVTLISINESYLGNFNDAGGVNQMNTEYNIKIIINV